MQTESSRDYHMRRARFELDLAYRAEGWAAMEAHLKLSALHMARLRDRTPERLELAARGKRPDSPPHPAFAC